MKQRMISKTLSLLGLSLAAHAAFAGNITDIKVSTLPSNQKIIKIKFDKDVIAPSGFTTTTPARIALDFAGTNIELAQPELEYADPLLNKITAAQNSNRARILLGLNKAAAYNTEIKGNEVWVYVTEAAGETQAAAPAPDIQSRVISEQVVRTPAPQAAQQMVANANIDFHKGARNAGVVELSAPSFQGQPDIKKQNDRVVITLKNYPLPTRGQRNLDVTDFNTPVRSVVMKRLGNDTQIVIRNQGSWDLNTRSSAGHFSFAITKQASVESAGLVKANKSFKGRRISLDFQDVDVRTILQILAKESGMNIVASDSVTGKMTLTLKDVPWDQALDLVMQARNLDMRRQGNIINVAPREELLAQDKSTLQAQKEIEELGPLLSQTFQLKYKNVEEFRKILRLDTNGNSNDKNTLLSSRGSALIDPSTNTLIVTDNRTVIQKFQKLIDQLDVPARQVMIEARIVEASDKFARDLGTQFSYSKDNNRNDWSSNVSLLPSASTSSLTLVHSLSSAALNLQLAASQTEGKAEVISSPRVLTQDRKEAVIESGTEIPYQESTSSGATSISFKKAVLGLTVTPNITPDGQIIMSLKINKDSPKSCTVGSESTLCVDTKTMTTQAMVENGGTLIVGGIYTEDNSDSVNKVPLLGDIPVVGNLFKMHSRNNNRSELLIFITPRIMDSMGSTLRY